MKRDICGIMIDDLDRRSLCKEICKRLEAGTPTVIFTPNPIMAQNAKKDPEFMGVLSRSHFNIPDGNGMILASRLLKTPLTERISGIDLGEALLSYAAEQGLGVFLYGGKEGVAQRAALRLKSRLPSLKICGTSHGYRKSEDNGALLDEINSSGASLLYVCTGSPTQEKWIDENAPKLEGILLFMGLGGSLDVWSGDVARAPRVLQKCGGEWAWRMAKNPKKIKDLPKLISFGVSTVVKGLANIGTMHR